MIECKNVKLNIYNIDILNDISLSINDNSVTCILGNKNSGKSSLLKLLVGRHKHYYGEILYNGKDINDVKGMDIDIIHDTRENDPYISVIEYLQFYGAIYKKHNEEELNSYIDNMLRTFSLMSYKYTSIDLLDNESYKLVELIRVLINDPKVILFDNLFSSDNIDFNNKLFDFIKTLIGKKTLVFAARSLNYIESIVDYIGILDAGTLVIYDKKENVYKKAELSNRIEIELIGGMAEAIEVLKANDNITNLVYDDNMISFSMVSSIAYTVKRNEVESDILSKLISKGIKVYSFKKQRVRFEQLFSRIKG